MTNVFKFFLALSLVVFFTGCTRPQYQPKAWVSVTKPPIQIIYMDYENDITPSTVHCLTEQVKNIPFKDYKFNDSYSVGVEWNVMSHSSHTDTAVMQISK